MLSVAEVRRVRHAHVTQSFHIDLRKASRRCETHRYQMVSGYAVIAQLCGLMESLIMRR